MRSRSLFRTLAAALAVLALFAAAASRGQTTPDQQTQLSTEGGSFPLGVTAEYLGMAGLKTVVRVRLRAPELSMAAAKRGLTSFSGELRGSIVRKDQVADSFRYPVSGEVSTHSTFTYAFLRALEPGSYTLQLALAAPGGRVVGEASIDLSVPEVGNPFSPDLAPGEMGTMPSAEAVVIADEAGGAKPVDGAGGGTKLKILPPSREAPIGLLRLDASIEPPITKVEFWLEEKLLVSRTKPPYSVEIDLGDVPRRQTVRAVGYDSNGKLIDEDAWSINQGSARLAVKVLPEPNAESGKVRVKVAVQSIAGGVPKSVELFLDEKKLKTWLTPEGPYELVLPFTEYSRGNYLRATALGMDGQEANDIRFLKGPNTTVESVRVDVVQLHISALDKTNHFVRGLAEGDFAIQEDGRPQKITGFEIAEKLPLTIGLVVDGSGSMEKSMPFVHEASAELFKGLIREKDKGFVIEFREHAADGAGADRRLVARCSARRGSRRRGGPPPSSTPSCWVSTNSARCRAARPWSW